MKLEDSRAACRKTDSALLAVAEDLELLGVPLCKEFAEMILVANALDAEDSSAHAEILAEPPTAAEEAAAQVVYAVTTLAHRPGVPEEVARALTRRLAFFTARFESYLAERDPLDAGLADFLQIGE